MVKLNRRAAAHQRQRQVPDALDGMFMISRQHGHRQQQGRSCQNAVDHVARICASGGSRCTSARPAQAVRAMGMPSAVTPNRREHQDGHRAACRSCYCGDVGASGRVDVGRSSLSCIASWNRRAG
jgi:hypothetical protein